MGRELPEGVSMESRGDGYVVTIDTRSMVRLIIMQLLPMAFILGIAAFLLAKGMKFALFMMLPALGAFVLYARERMAMNLSGKITLTSSSKGLTVLVQGPLGVDKQLEHSWKEIQEISSNYTYSGSAANLSRGNEEFGITISIHALGDFKFGNGYLDRYQSSFVLDFLRSQKR